MTIKILNIDATVAAHRRTATIDDEAAPRLTNPAPMIIDQGAALDVDLTALTRRTVETIG
jgi:hypothetical protein